MLTNVLEMDSGDVCIMWRYVTWQKELVTQSCLTATLWTVAHQASLSMGILQARILEWVVMPSSRVSSWPRDWTRVSCMAGSFFTIWATREAQHDRTICLIMVALNQMSVFPQIQMLTPNPHCDSTGKWSSLWEVIRSAVASWMGVGPFWKRSPLCHVRTQGEDSIQEPRSEFPPDTTPSRASIPDFSVLRRLRNKFLLFISHPGYDIFVIAKRQ